MRLNLFGAMTALMLASGCMATAARRPLSPTEPQLLAAAARMRDSAAAAILVRDVDRALSILPNAELVLPDGRAVRGRQAFLELADPQRWLLGAQAEFFREGVHTCTSAFHEYGTVAVYGRSSARHPVVIARYALEWTVRDGAPVLRRARLFALAERDLARARPCAAPIDSIFRSQRITLAVYPAAASAARVTWPDAIDRRLSDVGWGTADLDGVDGPLPAHEAELRHAFAARLRIGDSFAATAFVAGLDGTKGARHPNLTVARLSYGGPIIGLLAGYEYRLVSVNAGPALLALSGDWMTERPSDESWPAAPARTSWRRNAIGAIADVSITYPLRGWFALDARVQHRWFPTMTLPGYLGAPSFAAGFSHTTALLGAGFAF